MWFSRSISADTAADKSCKACKTQSEASTECFLATLPTTIAIDRSIKAPFSDRCSLQDAIVERCKALNASGRSHIIYVPHKYLELNILLSSASLALIAMRNKFDETISESLIHSTFKRITLLDDNYIFGCSIADLLNVWAVIYSDSVQRGSVASMSRDQSSHFFKILMMQNIEGFCYDEETVHPIMWDFYMEMMRDHFGIVTTTLKNRRIIS